MAITSVATGTGLSNVNIPLCAINRSLVPATSVVPSLQLPMADANGLVQLGLWEDERASTINLPDFEGLLKEIPLYIPALEGARVVQNLIQYSDDFSNAAWVKQGADAPTVEALDEGYRVTWASGGLGNLIQTISNVAEGEEYSCSIYLRNVTGNPTSLQLISNDSGGVWLVVQVESLVTSEWQRFSKTHTVRSGATSLEWYLRNAVDDGSEITVEVKSAQVELISGQTNTNPSEYVAHLGDSSIDDGFAYYTRQNNITIDGNGIATDPGPGALISPAPYFVHWPQSQNLIRYSDDLANVANWSQTNITPTEILTPFGDGANLVENTANANHRISKTHSGYTAQAYRVSMYMRAGARDVFTLTIQSGVAPGTDHAYFDTSDGTTEVTANFSDVEFEETNQSGWWRGAVTFTATGSGSLNCGMGLTVAKGTTGYAGDGSSDGDVAGIQVEPLTFTSPYIVNSGSTVVTRFATLMRYPFSDTVFNQAEGMVVVDFDIINNATESNVGIFACKESAYSVLYKSGSTAVRTFDDTSTATRATVAFADGQNNKTATRWNASTPDMQVSRDSGAGWTSDSAAYDGDYSVGAFFTVMFENNWSCKINTLDLYTVDQGQPWIESNY